MTDRFNNNNNKGRFSKKSEIENKSTGRFGNIPTQKNTKATNTSDTNNKITHNKKKFVITAIGLIVVMGGGFAVYKHNTKEVIPPVISYSNSKDQAIQNMLNSWQQAQATGVLNQVSSEQGLYVPQELSYFNRDKQLEDFYHQIISVVKYQPKPSYEFSNKGKKYKRLGVYADNEYTFEVPDYNNLIERVQQTDGLKIQQAVKQKGIKSSDYEYHKELIHLFLGYIKAYGTKIPTKTVTVQLGVSKKGSGYEVTDDSKLDDLLFSSQDFHHLLDTFGYVANGKIGKWEINPAYKEWLNRKNKYQQSLEKQVIGLTGKQLQSGKSMYNALQDNVNSKYASVIDNLETDVNNAYTESYTNNRQQQLSLKLKGSQIGSLVEINKGTFESQQDTNKVEDDTEFSKLAKVVRQQKEDQKYKGKMQQESNELYRLKKQHKTKEYKKLENKHIFTERMSKILPVEHQYQNDTHILSVQEQNIGVEPPEYTYIREQQKNPAYNNYKELTVKDFLVPPLKTINQPLKNQGVIPYTFIGANYLSNEYEDAQGKKVKVTPQVGNGTKDYPATVGTTLLVKAHDTKNQVHTVKVRITGILSGSKANSYVANIDNRNEGFDNSSAYKLVVVQFQMLNVENKPVNLESGLQLVDSGGNPVARSGKMYSMRQSGIVKPGQVQTFEDWFYTSNPDSLYLTWGKGFNKKYPLNWFRVLGYNQNK